MKFNPFGLSGKSVMAAGALSMLLMAGCDKTIEEPAGISGQTASADLASEQGRAHMPNELLVKFKAGVSEEAKAKVLAKIGGKVAEKILTKAMENQNDKEGLLVVWTPLVALEAMNKVRGGVEIAYAEPNYVYQHSATSNDPYYTNPYLWGMYGDRTSPVNQYGSQAGEAWAANHTGSSTVYVGIIDEGVMVRHEDLAANIWTNPYDSVNGVDDDRNGYIDDVNGWDFAGNNNSVFDGTGDDHGTHVAGTIGAVGGNGKGVAGVNWKVKMISAKFLGSTGGTTANAVKALDYITDLKKRHGLNIPATNNSWGGGGYSQALKDAIDRSNAVNILFVAAAGNGGSDGVGDNNDATPNYPSNYTSANVIAVAAITSSGGRSSFSNYGATTVDIGAPGSSIYSTLPGTNNTSAYGGYSGTSMATPHVTGGVALYASTHPGVTAAQIKAAILNSAVPTSSLSGRCVTGGRLNVGGF